MRGMMHRSFSVLLPILSVLAPPSNGAASPLVTAVYECRGLGDVYVQFGEEDAAVLNRDSAILLRRTRSASGARFTSGDSLFWDNAGEAAIRLDGRPAETCRANKVRAPWADATLRGVVFRAVGNEPGWTLEIDRDHKVTLAIAESGKRIAFVAHAPEGLAAGGRVYRAATKGGYLSVTIIDGSCSDTLSGERLPAAVRIEIDGRTLAGCGRHL